VARLKVVLASRNPYKLAELRPLLPGWELAPLDVDGYPQEAGPAYVDNARGKARFARGLAEPEAWVLGEDSGIEVEGLGGGPGPGSARYAGPGEDPVEKLLAELAGVEGAGRRARYVCELVCVSPQGRELRGTGVLAGRIAPGARGDEGFGYDPVFVPSGEERTVAELGNAWKREHSHRARAVASLLAGLQDT
jgi:XTP/dITP diphosphohydrolase